MDSQQAMTLCLDREVTSIRHSVTTGLMLLRKAKHIDDSFETCLIFLPYLTGKNKQHGRRHR